MVIRSRQLDLFARPVIGFDAAFRAAQRRELAFGAWVEHVPGWLAGHDELFEQLERKLDWRSETRQMYDREVVTPRLLASVPREGIVEQMRLALSARYGEEFVRTTAALYRDGKDSVAFHGDTTARDMLEALVASVSLGQPRRLMLKPTEGGESIESPQRSALLRGAAKPRLSIAYMLGHGDLFVMGGTCQRTWRHGIPKTTRALGPRIALMFRPDWAY